MAKKPVVSKDTRKSSQTNGTVGQTSGRNVRRQQPK